METARRVSYDCPHCRHRLQAEPGRWEGWLLCPRCGLPGMPPRPPLNRGKSSLARSQPLPGPRPASIRGVFVTNPPRESRLARPEYATGALASVATIASLASLVFLNHLKLESVVTAGLLVVLIGVFTVLRGRGR